MLFSNGTLLQDNAGARFIHMQHLFLGLLSSIGLLAGASEGFAINRQMDVLLACLSH
jgi:hypothetical protein